MRTIEPLRPAEARKSVKSTIEQLYAQLIYAAVIRSLVAFGSGPDDFLLNEDEVEWLARTFYRENLGSQEHAYLCMGMAWEHTTHKSDECDVKRKHHPFS